MTYGYVRVSSSDQNPDRQIAAMIENGISEENIFIDKQSGKDFDRAQYKKLLRTAKRNDVIIIKSIDRIGRNYDEIRDQWRIITKDRGIGIKVIDMPLLDTTNDKDLTGTFIADLVLQILAYVAETERIFIKQRQAEGIAIAKRKGVRFGRAQKIMPDDFPLYAEMYQRGEISIRKAAKDLHISPTTFYRKAKTYVNEAETELNALIEEAANHEMQNL